jgi:hypothetical protein
MQWARRSKVPKGRRITGTILFSNSWEQFFPILSNSFPTEPLVLERNEKRKEK